MKVETAEPPALRVLRHPLVLLAALAAGAALGLFRAELSRALQPVGDVYLLLVQMTVLPILVLAIVWGVASLVQVPGTAGLLVRAILVLALLLLLSGAVGLGVASIVRPGSELSETGTAYLADLIRLSPQGADAQVSLSETTAPRARSTVLDMLANVVPRNVFASLSSGVVVQAALFSLLLGLAIGLLRDKQKVQLVALAQSGLEAFKALNRWLTYLLPVAVVCLVSYQVATAGATVLGVLLRFLITLAATMAAISVPLFVVVWRGSGKSLGRVISALAEPLTYAFITGSGLLALPSSLRVMTDRLGFRADRVQATLPAAAILGRCGHMVTFVLGAAFAAHFYGVTWSLADYGVLLAAAAVGSIATAGTTGVAALGMMGLVFAPLGLPADPVAVVIAGASLVIVPVVAAFETQAAIAAVCLVARSPVVGGAPVRVSARRLFSLRASVVSLIAALIILTGLVSIGLMYTGQRRNVAHLADATMRDISARVVQRTDNYFSPAERATETLRFLLEDGSLGMGDRNELLSLLRNTVNGNPEFAAVYLGDASGTFTMVKRMPDGSLSERLIGRTDVSVVVDWRHGNPAYAQAFPDTVEPPELGYDPRSRGWYREAVLRGGRIWTDVYLFASDNMLGISNAIPIYRAGSGAATDRTPAGVLAVDIGLAELSYFLGSLDISDTGAAYILNEKDQLVALSVPRGSDLSALFSGAPTGSAASTANLVPADAASNELVRQSFLTYLRQQRSADMFPVQVGRESYLSSITDFPAAEAFRWKIGIVVPESEIYGFVNETTRTVLLAALLIIVVAIGLGANLSRAITLPLRRLSMAMERIRNFDLSGQEQTDSRIAEIQNMAVSFANMKHGLSAFNKYVPSKLVAELIRLGEEPRIGGHRRKLTILFTDIADFTTISEQLKPESLVDDLAVYFGALGNTIMKGRGTVDKYIGDAIMAFWNAPGDVPDHEVQACLAAIECQDVLARLRRQARGHPAGGVGARRTMSIFANATRMGIHTGEVIVGNMGSEERLNYTAVGDSVNVASRLEGLNKHYGTNLIVSETTYDAARSAVVARLVDRVAVKGREAGIHIYELVDRVDRIRPQTLRFVETSSRVVRHYLEGDFKGALALGKEALHMRPEDGALAIVLERCRVYVRDPPRDWKGVFVHHAK